MQPYLYKLFSFVFFFILDFCMDERPIVIFFYYLVSLTLLHFRNIREIKQYMRNLAVFQRTLGPIEKDISTWGYDAYFQGFLKEVEGLRRPEDHSVIYVFHK